MGVLEPREPFAAGSGAMPQLLRHNVRRRHQGASNLQQCASYLRKSRGKFLAEAPSANIIA